MFYRVDSAELISFFAKRSGRKSFRISIQEVRKRGHELEKESSLVIYDGDKYTIESFRCMCSRGIKVVNNIIIVDTTNKDVQQIIARYQPSEEIEKMLSKNK